MVAEGDRCAPILFRLMYEAAMSTGAILNTVVHGQHQFLIVGLTSV